MDNEAHVFRRPHNEVRYSEVTKNPDGDFGKLFIASHLRQIIWELSVIFQPATTMPGFRRIGLHKRPQKSKSGHWNARDGNFYLNRKFFSLHIMALDKAKRDLSRILVSDKYWRDYDENVSLFPNGNKSHWAFGLFWRFNYWCWKEEMIMSEVKDFK